MRGLVTVFWKELSDHFSSVRFLVLLALVYLAGVLAIYVTASAIKEGGGAGEFVFLYLFTARGEALPSFLNFIALFVPIIGIALGFDAINSERAGGTLSRVLSQPLFRDAVINGKFLAGVATMGIMLLSIILIVAGMGLRLLGVPPGSEEVLRLAAFFFLTLIYGAFWMGIAVLFSILLQRAATSALASIAMWFFFLFFMSIIAGVIAQTLVPVAQDSSMSVAVQNEEVRRLVMLFSPSSLYDEATAVLLVPQLRSLGPVMVGDAVYMLANPLTLDQSLLMVWPHISTLVGLTVLCFGISYIRFMREEIRST